ncbi:DUF1127 domain-containing protein [Pseudomonas monteilii]|uniref:DUF1127 domain-containing protein n=1 Tax=Pseudomonas monteilii TaxID=76759 RepID=UPI0018AAE47A|nr:DUF1127 domain-containing protein [Pseudomonas monteilii]MBF8748886.1 DUF1127 domain-containing protein [Pseudomonas monteilii]
MKGHVSSIQQPAFSFSSLWHRLLQRVTRWQQLYRQRRELASLGDETLKDLGLSRADIMQEAERPFWDDPLRK